MSTQQQPDTTDDWIALLMLLTGVSGMGLFSLGAFVAPVRDALVQWGLLAQGEEVLIPLMDGGVGFDIWRILIIAGIVVLFVAGSILLARKRRREGR